MRARTAIIGTALVLLLLAGIGIFVAVNELGRNLPAPVSRACVVNTPSGQVRLDPTQMANAATIAAVGIRRKLPDQAIVVALATALQESKLENLETGDRDSVGLFQQRPSQGWGTAEQIQDPRYAAGRFYAALVRVKGWESMRVTEAAQRVQRSAFPEAYEKWADESAVLTEALAGRASMAVSCSKVGEPGLRGVDAAQALDDGLRLDWGDVIARTNTEIVGLVLSAADEQSGWQYAHWLVAHSAERNVERVRYGDQEWTADRGEWNRLDGDRGQRDVVAEVYRS